MRKAISVLLMLALLAGVLLMWHSSGRAFSFAGASSASVSAQLSQADPNTCFCVTGKPTVSAAFIKQVLAYYHSPAQRLSTAIYSLGVKYGINPVYALAFFMHESRFGTLGIARVTLSPGNIRCAPGYPCLDGYRVYASWTQGFAGWYSLIRSLYVNQWHKITVEQIIPTYAPSSDHNNVAAYIAAVESAVRTWQSGKVEVQP
jgi:hypothetical protein